MVTLAASFILGMLVVLVGSILGIVIARQVMYKRESYQYNKAFYEGKDNETIGQ